MSDWTSVYSTIGPANGGLDLEMPKTKYFAPDKLKEALATGRITEKTIDEKVEHLLSTFIAFGLLDRVQKLDSIPLDYDRSRRTALDVAREGIVLLKNDGDLLPLKGRTLILGPQRRYNRVGWRQQFGLPVLRSAGRKSAEAAHRQDFPFG